jgi:short-subunit dehydrogenase
LDTSTLFAGKKVIITGGASGIGLALANLFAASQATLLLLDINGEKVATVAAEMAARFQTSVYARALDVGNFASFKSVIDEMALELGQIDIFINNAGIGVSGELYHNSLAEIQAITQVNYLGVVYGSKIILDHFYAQGFGQLVNIASVGGLQGFPLMSLYCGTKFGVIGFSQAIRFELERHGIAVSVVMPSTTDTAMVSGKLATTGQETVVPGMLMAIPTCRVEDVAQKIFHGIRKRTFLIFPSWAERGAYYLRSWAPWLFDILIRQLGFRSFAKKKARLIRNYQRSQEQTTPK